MSLLNFSFPDQLEQPRYLREVKLVDTATQEVFYDKLTFIYLEVDRFTKATEELETQFEKWLYLLKNLHKLEDIPDKFRNRTFVKLFNQAEIAKLTKKEMNAYEESQKVYWDNHAVMESAQEIGKEIGEKIGKEIGKEEERMTIARAMKKKNLSTDIIAETTGLSKEQVNAL